VSQLIVIHKKQTIIGVQVTVIGETIVNINELLVDISLKQHREHFHENITNFVPRKQLTFSQDNTIAHFIVLSHGNNGTEADVLYMSELLTALFNQYVPHQDFYVLCATANSGDTWNGIDIGGTRLSKEIEQYYQLYLQNYSKVYFSIVGHSLGGLYIRYAVSQLMNHPEFGYKLIPTSFMTISSPHLGARKPSGSLMKNIFKSAADVYMNQVLKETGKQLSLKDSGHNGINEPLIVQMSDPTSVFTQSLNMFKHRTLAAATCFDMIVPHCTAAIMHGHDFPSPAFGGLSFQVVGHNGFDASDTNYSEILEADKSIVFTPDAIDTTELYSVDKALEQEYHTTCMKNLQTIQWRRLHLQFEVMSSRQVLNGTVHGIVINKKSPISVLVQDDNIAAIQCVELLSQILLSDHVN
jgi:hypothetical protein